MRYTNASFFQLALAALICSGTVCSAIAAPAQAEQLIAQEESTDQEEATDLTQVRGKVLSVNGPNVEIQQEDGDVMFLTLSKDELLRYGIMPGSNVIVTMNNGRVVEIAKAQTGMIVATTQRETVVQTEEPTETVEEEPIEEEPIEEETVQRETIRRETITRTEPVEAEEPVSQPVRALW